MPVCGIAATRTPCRSRCLPTGYRCHHFRTASRCHRRRLDAQLVTTRRIRPPNCVAVTGHWVVLDVVVIRHTEEVASSRRKNVAQRSDEGQQGRCAAARRKTNKNQPRPLPGRTKNKGWLAGRWRLHGGAAVDAAMLMCVGLVISKLCSRYKAAECSD